MSKKKWIQAIGLKKGALHKDLNVPAGQKIPASKIQSAANSDDKKTAARARFAILLGKMRAKRKSRSK